MTRQKILAAALGAGLLAGCAAIPDVKPQVSQADAASLGLTAQPTMPVESNWWSGLGDPQLDRIMGDALAGNPTLDGALARLRVAEAGLAAEKAGRLPQLDADINEQYQRLSGKYTIPPPYGGSRQWVGTAQANLGWSLDIAGKQKAMIDQARASADAAALDVAAARIALSGAVAQTYVNFARADADAKIAAQFVASREASLSLARTRKRSDLGSDFEIRAAQTLLAEARQAEVRAKGDRALAIHALAALAGRGADYYGTIAAPVLRIDKALPVPASLPADLLGRRADILAAQARIEVGRAGRRVAHAQFYPDIDLRAFVGTAALGLGELFTGSAFTAGVGPAIHLPIFEGGRLSAEYKAATGRIDVAVAAYDELVVQAVKQVADALSAVETDAADAAQQRAIVADLQETVRLDGVRVSSGLGSRLDVLAANDRLLSARLAQAGIDASAAIHRVQLLVALGGGFTSIPTTPLALGAVTQTQK